MKSMFAFLNYLKTGEDRERYWGCRIYPFGVTEEGIEQAKSFAQELAKDHVTQPTDQSPSAEEKDMSRQQFVGTWKLLSSEMVSDDDVIYPLGPNCQGIINFDAAGKLNGQLMNPDRPKFASQDMLGGTPEEVQAAYRGYVAFWADYTVDEDKGVMSYTVIGSLFPNWVGHSQERLYTFEGDRLTLKTSPLSLGGKENVVGVLVWERIPGS